MTMTEGMTSLSIGDSLLVIVHQLHSASPRAFRSDTASAAQLASIGDAPRCAKPSAGPGSSGGSVAGEELDHAGPGLRFAMRRSWSRSGELCHSQDSET